ncbi:hypothetical protein [Peterkaempfera sp. SMS 1(5)a]|uniref:RipA family octameric membrane protein n=1 Tax=Peterkaempfera podocarpi TaxID=3232308 RepID=UPI00366D229D
MSNLPPRPATSEPTVGQRLWNPSVGPAQYQDSSESYQSALIEQYKLCVEMADRVSARRNAANTFFLTVNSAVVTLLAAVLPTTNGAPVGALIVGLIVLLLICLSWFTLIRSYRQLNAAKWAVIGALEDKLPAYAYSRAEWGLLGSGNDWRKYLQLSYVEQWVPVGFAVAYIVGFVTLPR